MENRTSRKIQKTKNVIIDVAIELFKEKGVDNTKMEEISETADIAKGTLYNHFSCKEAIIDGYMKRKFNNDKFNLSFNENLPLREMTKEILLILCKSIDENKDIFEKHLIFSMQKMVSLDSEKKQGGFGNIGNFIINKGIDSGEIRNDLPHYVLRQLFEFTFIQLVKEVYNSKNINEIIDNYVDLFFNGVMKEEL